MASDSLLQSIGSGLTGNGLSEGSGTDGDTKGFINSDSLSYTPASTNDLSSGLNQLISLPSLDSDFSVSQVEQEADN